MIFNGHISHVSLEIITIAKDNDLILLCLPPHSSAFLQPLDRGAFRDVKDKWKDRLLEPSILKQFQEKHKQPRNSTKTRLGRKFGQVLTDSEVHQRFIKGQEERQNRTETQIKRKAEILAKRNERELLANKKKKKK